MAVFTSLGYTALLMVVCAGFGYGAYEIATGIFTQAAGHIGFGAGLILLNLFSTCSLFYTSLVKRKT